MKPRITRILHWVDCGWPYELWLCCCPNGFQGVGSTPKEAYLNYVESTR